MFNHLSEYIVKVPGVLSPSICKKIKDGIDEDVLMKLVEIQREIFKQYSSVLIPKGLFEDFDTSSYSFEFDQIIASENDDGFYNIGGVDTSHRFLTFMFIINNDLFNTTLNFPLQKTTNICKLGDLYVFPTNFSYRFYVDLAKGEEFMSASLHLCFVVDN